MASSVTLVVFFVMLVAIAALRVAGGIRRANAQRAKRGGLHAATGGIAVDIGAASSSCASDGTSTPDWTGGGGKCGGAGASSGWDSGSGDGGGGGGD